MLNILLIFFGAGIGGVCRYGVANGMYALFGKNFPTGTLVVNISGSFLIGLLAILIFDRFGEIAPQLRSLTIIGFLGGYTTFSSFSFETLSLIENGTIFSAILYILLSVSLCLIAAWIGILLGRQI